MARLSEYVIDGYLYADANQLEEARRESEGVEYVRSRLDMNNPFSVLKIYNKMIDQNMFKSQVGTSFLRELQDYLYSCASINPDDVKAIPMTPPPKPKIVKENLAEDERGRLKRKQWWLVATIVALVVTIVVMFVIMATADHPTILNYENEIIDKYSAWEEELKAREEALKEKTRALDVELDYQEQ